MGKTATYTDEELLDHAKEFDEKVREYSAFLLKDIKESGLKIDYTHHWAWNPKLGRIEYATDNLVRKPKRVPKPCIHCGRNPKT